MKVIYFRLKGYINILNGMGIDELVIPFNTFKNRIVLISGQNGTGKSTIIQALSPTPDNSDSFRTDVFIDSFGNRQIIEYPAEKEIVYSDGNDEYRILIQSLVDESKTRRTTKAFISRNGEELNPNGNVASFKDVRDSVLNIDPIYLDLSSISSEHRGIVDMIPSERRKYMAAYIGSLDTYNNIFKVISKKVTTLKSYMNTINNKLYELGDENELRIKQIQLETQLDNYNKKRDSILKDLSEAETTVKLIDPDNKIQDLYSSISDNLTTINAQITENDKKSLSLYSKLKISIENEDIEELIKEKDSALEDYKNQLTDNTSRYNSLTSINEVLSSTIESDRTKLLALTKDSVKDNIESAVSEMQDKVNMYESYLTEDDINILDDTSLDELLDLQSLLNRFKNDISIIEELYSMDIFEKGVRNYNSSTSIENLISESRKNSTDLRIEYESLKKDIESYWKDLETLKEFNNTRPENCVSDTCPYIAKYINLQKDAKSEEEIKSLEKELLRLDEEIKSNDSNIDNCNEILDISRKINNTLRLVSGKNIFNKITKLKYMLDDESIIEKIALHNDFSEFKVVDELIEKRSIYDDLVSSKLELASMESDLKIYLTNKEMIDSLNLSISSNEDKLNKNNEEISSIMKNMVFLNNVINETSDILTTLNEIKSCIDEKNNLLNQKEELRKSFNAVKDNIKTVKEKVDSVNDLKDELNKCEEAITPLSDNINIIKFTLTNIVGYQNELKESNDKYDKISFIRNCCSPGNGMGIQSEYIKRYMSDIIIECNRMLAYMFNGAIQLDVPIINEKQFSMPFIGLGGMQVPDISNGSTAQKCMIGLVFSCVAMMKSSLKYNIPRLDEIDGGLDQNNRITFIQVLNQILDIMHSEQCIICSHNTEFDTYSTTKVICSTGGIRIEQ